MTYYPIHLSLFRKHCLVVGGGAVGVRKVNTLLQCKATVSVVSPTVLPMIQDLANQEKISLFLRPYQRNDLDSIFLVFATTNQVTINQRIADDAHKRDILCNIADAPDSSNFILPSFFTRGDLMITISTNGKSPALAKRLRKQLEIQFGDEYAILLQIMGAIRNHILATNHDPDHHKILFHQFLDDDLLTMITNQNWKQIDIYLKDKIGLTLSELMGPDWIK